MLINHVTCDNQIHGGEGWESNLTLEIEKQDQDYLRFLTSFTIEMV